MDEPIPELTKPKRMALTQDEIALVLRHREAKNRYVEHRAKVEKAILEWIEGPVLRPVDRTSMAAPQAADSHLYACVDELVDAIVGPEPTI